MAKRERIRSIYVAPESTYGVDPTVVGTDYVPAEDLEVGYFEADTIQSNAAQSYFGARPETPVNLRRSASFGLISGLQSGAAGTAPKVGSLLQHCGLLETVNAGTDVTYTPYTDDPTSCWFEGYFDGDRFIGPGARSSFELLAPLDNYLRYNFSFLGLMREPDATADPPAPDLTGWSLTLPVTAATTPTLTIGGSGFAGKNFALTSGNEIQKDGSFGSGGETVEMTDRDTSLEITITAVPVSTKDWRAIAQNQTLEAIVLTHGTLAGFITTVTCPSCQLRGISRAFQNGIETTTLNYKVLPVAGNDEFSIVMT